MHEFSFCEGIIKTLLAEYEKLDGNIKTNGRITGVRLAVGSLHQIVPESLQLAWEILSAETPFAQAVLALRFIPVRIACHVCGVQSDLEQTLFICPACESRDVSTLAGNELYIEEMEVETNE